MSKEIVIDCKTNGTVSGMHFDQFPLSFLGDMKVERASEIFYNHETKLWDIILPDMDSAWTAAKGFEGYDVARSFEVNWLQECRKRSTQPDTYNGAMIAAELRQRCSTTPR